jgi:hypothetical protein
MTPDEAVKLVGQWPKDKAVPKQLRVAYDQAKGEEKQMIGMLSEALMAAAGTPEDFALIAKHWS